MRAPIAGITITLVVALATLLAKPALAAGIRIVIPKHTEATPVQKLNREGVREIKKRHLDRAEKLFYRAYLLDPDDPYTLNNLGYISELKGEVQRAERYYQLAAKENNSESVISQASEPKAEGQKLSAITGSYGNLQLRVNRGNVLAMSLLQQGRNQEAEDILRDTLKLDPANPFTLNNLGFAMEGQGDLQSALSYYNEASVKHSSEQIVVALDPHWRGKSISDIAFQNEESVRRLLATEKSDQEQAARLNVEGVSALNHNEPKRAIDYFQRAYKLDPQSAFSLNNMGYVSELYGDQETADDFYQQASRGDQAGTPVNIASRHEMVGDAAGQVASANAQGSEASLRAGAEIKRQRHEPIVLRRRNNTPVSSPQSPNIPRPPVDNAPVENPVPRPPQ